jgi:hypothetical protein
MKPQTVVLAETACTAQWSNFVAGLALSRYAKLVPMVTSSWPFHAT